MADRITRSQSANLARHRGAIPPEQSAEPQPTGMGLRHRISQMTAHFLNDEALAVELKKSTKKNLALLRLKQQRLRQPHAQIPAFTRRCLASCEKRGELLAEAAAATLVFAGESAGTAVCISPDGLLLTCSHCIAESEDEYEYDTAFWLLFASGNAVEARCISWDDKRDLALLQITRAPVTASPFPYIRLSTGPPSAKAAMFCIGHPGSEDLEAGKPGVATNYDVLHISEGRFKGMAKGQDPQDNSEIGALMHDCWTYWGHSGAPLIEKKTGTLVGLHSSWDDQTSMRRGVSWEALTAFLHQETHQAIPA